MTSKLRALSVTQPYATYIIGGTKNVENRGWAPKGVTFPFWMAIHATRDNGGLDPVRFPTSCILGVARVTKVLRPDTPEAQERVIVDKYAMANCCLWVMDLKILLANPVPCKGQRGLWLLDDELFARVMAELGENAREVV